MLLLSCLFAVSIAVGSPAVISWVAPEVPPKPRWAAIALAPLFALALSMAGAAVISDSVLFALAVGMVSAVLATQLVIDICVKRLPRVLSYSGAVAFFLIAAFVPRGSNAGVAGMISGIVLMTAITGILVFFSRGALGIGDLHLAPLLGSIIGWYDPFGVLLAWMVAAIAGGSFVLIAMVMRRINRGSMVAYGPFLMLGTVVSVLWSAGR